MIWVRADERPAILAKIGQNPAVSSFYTDFKARADGYRKHYEANPKAFLDRLPTGTYTSFRGTPRKERMVMINTLRSAIDCGVIYFLEKDERYASYAEDVLRKAVDIVNNIPPSTDKGNGGIMYPNDHLREAREIGAQLPIIYDFIHDHITDEALIEDAERLFRTYARLAIDHGHAGSNWSILEASSLVHSALALSDPDERAELLSYFLEKSSKHQDALPEIGKTYRDYGGSWPESLNYSQATGKYLTRLLATLDHYDPKLNLAELYPEILHALPEAYYLTYPGGEKTVLFGDGHREYKPQLDGYEIAYHLAGREEDQELQQVFGALINAAVAKDGYERFHLDDYGGGASIYAEPLKLLWYAAKIDVPAGDYPLPTTTELPFAGMTIQRNLTPNGQPEDGLMGFVGGGSHVHSHATGMSMELFGKGFVLGSKGGRVRYRTEIHENYYRLMASNNTVIVNGASRSGGNWVRLGQDRIKRLAVEPLPGAKPVSPNFSFSTSAFHDTIGTGAEAYQERTLGIVRTTDSTGYYVDVFRSRSTLPDQYHDYIYRNVGDRLTLTGNGKEMSLRPDSDRFQENADGVWRQNRIYRHPGWHYFKKVRTFRLEKHEAVAVFTADGLGEQPIEMRAHFPGLAERSFTTATSPPLTEGPDKYRRKRAPTLVVRQEGEAWGNPFSVVYEPVISGQNSVASVTSFGRGRRGNGMIVRCNEKAGGVTQLILTPSDPNEEIILEKYDIRFRGRYAVVSMDNSGTVTSAYLGEGASLSIGDYQYRSGDDLPPSAFIDFTGNEPKVTH